MPKSIAFPTLDGLLDLACRDGIDIRPTLLRVLTDLYVQKLVHTADEEVQYVELALRLIEAVDTATRATVAARLSNYPAAPLVILRKLAGTTSLPATAVPAEVKPASAHELVELFFAASAEERALIMTNLDFVATTAARKLAPASNDVLRRLENAALQHNAGEFSHTLERALGIGHELAERIVRDASGEPIVVAAKALGMKAAVLQRILLFLNPVVGQSVQRVYDLARLYDEITLASAERMVAIWRQAGGRTQVRHEPATWDDERRSARVLATPLPHRAVRRNDAPPSRVKSSER
jgi:Uncharacterised protein conserved in bacteria (DUF2336)